MTKCLQPAAQVLSKHTQFRGQITSYLEADVGGGVATDRDRTGIFSLPRDGLASRNLDLVGIFFCFLGPHPQHIKVPRLEV